MNPDRLVAASFKIDSVFSRILVVFGLIVAWGWSVLSGLGGLGLLIIQGPWPLTNGWFALFSGLSACPLTAWVFRRWVGREFPVWARVLLAFLFVVVGRLALKIEGRAPFLPNFH